MMEPIRYREHSFRPDNDPVWRKRGLKTFLPRRLLGEWIGSRRAQLSVAENIPPLLLADVSSSWPETSVESVIVTRRFAPQIN